MFFQIWVEFQRDERKIILKPSSDIQEGPNFFFFFVFFGTGAGTLSRADGKHPSNTYYLNQQSTKLSILSLLR